MASNELNIEPEKIDRSKDMNSIQLPNVCLQLHNGELCADLFSAHGDLICTTGAKLHKCAVYLRGQIRVNAVLAIGDTVIEIPDYAVADLRDRYGLAPAFPP